MCLYMYVFCNAICKSFSRWHLGIEVARIRGYSDGVATRFGMTIDFHDCSLSTDQDRSMGLSRKTLDSSKSTVKESRSRRELDIFSTDVRCNSPLLPKPLTPFCGLCPYTIGILMILPFLPVQETRTTFFGDSCRLIHQFWFVFFSWSTWKSIGSYNDRHRSQITLTSIYTEGLRYWDLVYMSVKASTSVFLFILLTFDPAAT
jgi:hypothetical protein